ncbi:C40 family peptidase [Priestia taiwanensis]|uniref:N-acetylmuramoyl-L-alanine amidase n=1 Tax=Priestia taiwanensis TaxID=1347902 RepID=A0A917ENJ0_9BACI|nr:C40 family peptidase [Priestia taiwanensis]MBM7363040.1 N-acetylmuramoyl-L-alanine amidase [Priestia taiwanensis]GGE67120.1 N-acetylmuramoyl-L-alanine amidase [Priestia taiwanensis]
MKYKVLGITGAAIVGSIMLADSAEASQNQGVVTADVLNIRSGSDVSHSIIGKAYNGQVVTIVGEVNGWYKVNHQGKVGYVSGAYIKTQGSSSNVSQGTTGVYKVTADVLNVRSGSGTSHRIIGKAHQGQVLEVTGQENGWYKVNYNGQTGYVSAEYLQKAGEQPKPPTSGNVSGAYTVTASALNVRSGPNTSHGVIGKTYKGQTVTVTGQENGWYKINYNGKTGYVSADYLQKAGEQPTQPPKPPTSGNVSGAYTVTASSLNVRQGPSISSSKIGTVYNRQQVNVLESENGWYKISYNGKTGYVSSEYLVKSTGTTPEVTPPSDAAKASAMINYAKTLLGVPYVFGGSSPSTGIDCSGFIYHVLNKTGTKIGRTNVEGYWNDSRNFVKITKPQPGDIIFFQNTYRRGPSHIGIIIDNAGNFIHANEPRVKIDSMNNSYYKSKFLGFKRIK